MKKFIYTIFGVILFTGSAFAGDINCNSDDAKREIKDHLKKSFPEVKEIVLSISLGERPSFDGKFVVGTEFSFQLDRDWNKYYLGSILLDPKSCKKVGYRIVLGAIQRLDD